jgi:toxin ParE1/3/4
MAYRVKITARAQRDLADIFNRIGARTSECASNWYRGLRDAIMSLWTTPQRCPVTPENEELRHRLYGNKPHVYRVIYRILRNSKEVEILHIRHGARDQFTSEEL